MTEENDIDINPSGNAARDIRTAAECFAGAFSDTKRLVDAIEEGSASQKDVANLIKSAIKNARIGVSRLREINQIDPDEDPFYEDAVALVQKSNEASIILLRTMLKISYKRSERLLERMQKEGIVSNVDANGSRHVIKE